MPYFTTSQVFNFFYLINVKTITERIEAEIEIKELKPNQKAEFGKNNSRKCPRLFYSGQWSWL